MTTPVHDQPLAPSAGAAASAPTFRRVLVPLDGSRLASAALPAVRRLLLDAPAELTLARVVEPHEDAERAHGSAAEVAMRADLARTQEALGAGVTSRIELLRGDPAAEILRAARGHDLVAMATHGRTGLDRWVRGSVAERVLRTSTVPLLLCNPHTLVTRTLDRMERIVVPLDGSAEGARVIPLVRGVAAAHDARVTLLTVEVPALTELPGQGHGSDRAAIEPLADELRRGGLRVDVQEAFGPVATEILRASRDADLLAMTTHGRSGAGRWWFGSVAEEVLRRATCPLLLVVR